MTTMANGVKRSCPCEFLKTDLNPKGQCTAKGVLKITIPQVSMWGYFQITTHSIFARAGILSSLKSLYDQVGRIAYIPLKLTRVPEEIVHDGKAKTHYIVGFDPELTLPQIIQLRTTPELMVLPAQFQLEEAVDTNPADDPVDVVVDKDEEEIEAADLADMDDKELANVQAALNTKREGAAPAKTGGVHVWRWGVLAGQMLPPYLCNRRFNKRSRKRSHTPSHRNGRTGTAPFPPRNGRRSLPMWTAIQTCRPSSRTGRRSTTSRTSFASPAEGNRISWNL